MLEFKNPQSVMIKDGELFLLIKKFSGLKSVKIYTDSGLLLGIEDAEPLQFIHRVSKIEVDYREVKIYVKV